ncbi:MAG TPA: hypothetical protein ENJ82_01130 [Bacteroidetes bacterium]|nr:hypothetical protein [Bacteroidota bacterium]
MKQILNSSTILAFLLILMSGCGDNPQKKGPQETAEAFLTALQDDEYDLAKTFCTKGSRKNLSMFETFSGMGANPFGGAFSITREVLDGDYAKVYYTADDDEKEKFVRLRKDGNTWEVMASKADMSKSSDDDNGKSNKSFNFGSSDKNSLSDQEKLENKWQELRSGKSAQEIGEAFLDAIMFSDNDEAKKYASHSSQTALSMQSLGSKSSLSDYKTIRMEEKGKYAKLIYKEKGEDEEKVLKLGKDGNGNWQVLMSKDDNN